MRTVAARACDDIHRGSVGQARSKVEVHGGDLELLDYFLRKAHGGAAVADGHDAASVNRNARTAAAVAHGLAQNRDKCAVVASPRWRLCAGLQLGQFQKATPIEGQPLDLWARDHAADVMSVVANLRRGGVNGHGLSAGTQLHGEVDSRGAARFDDRLSREAVKSWRFGSHLVNSDQQNWGAVVAFVRSYQRALRGGLLVRDHYPSARNRRSCRVGDDARYGAGGSLRTDGSEGDELQAEDGKDNLFHCSPVQQRSVRQADAPQQVSKPGVGAERHESLVYLDELHVEAAQFDGLIEPLEGFVVQPKLGIVGGGPDRSRARCNVQHISVEKNSFRFWITRGGIFSLDSCSQLLCTAIVRFLRKRRRGLQPVFGGPERGEQFGESLSFHALALISQSHPAMSWVTHRATQGGYFTVLGECLIITTRR